MKKNKEIQDLFFREPVCVGESFYELTEDDFLVGKTPEFFPDIWEDEE
jgi:hypothetical protein